MARRRKVPTCRLCDCTDAHGCPEGCYWVEPDLCSVCARMLRAVTSNRPTQRVLRKLLDTADAETAVEFVRRVYSTPLSPAWRPPAAKLG